MTFTEEQIRDYIKGGLSKAERSELEKLVLSDLDFKAEVEEIAYFMVAARNLKRESLKKEFQRIPLDEQTKGFPKWLFIIAGIIVIGLIIYFATQKSNSPVNDTPKESTLMQDSVKQDTLLKEETKNDNAQKGDIQKIKSRFPDDLPVLTTVIIRGKTTDNKTKDEAPVDIVLVKNPTKEPYYIYEKNPNNAGYRLAIKGNFTEKQIKNAQIINLHKAGVNYQHLKVGKNFYRINETNGTYVKLIEETNPEVKKELKSFWKKLGEFLGGLFGKD